MIWIKEYFKKLTLLLKQGLSPKDLALSILFTIILTIIPLFGVSTVLIGFTALKLRLNLALMIALSYVVYPLQFILFVPFIKLGKWLFETKGAEITLDQMITLFKDDFITAFGDLGLLILGALISWLIISSLSAIPTYFILNRIFTFINKKKRIQI